MATKKQMLEYSNILRSAKAELNAGNIAAAIDLYQQSNTYPAASLLERTQTSKYIAELRTQLEQS